MDELVLAGTSGSRRDQPIEFNESRKEADAMFARVLTSVGGRPYQIWPQRVQSGSREKCRLLDNRFSSLLIRGWQPYQGEIA